MPVEEGEKQDIQKERETERLRGGIEFVFRGIAFDVSGDGQKEPQCEKRINDEKNGSVMYVVTEEQVGHAAVERVFLTIGREFLIDLCRIPSGFRDQPRGKERPERTDAKQAEGSSISG